MRWLFALVLVATTTTARADDGPEDIDASYLYDGGAVPLFWGPLLLGSALSIGLPPRDRPFGFSVTEGGAVKSQWQVPAWAIVALGVGTTAAIVASGDESRYFHAKGLAESLATTMFVTSLMKVTFSRQRPYWTKDEKDIDARRSFPSGHSSQAFAIAMYSVRYLHDHVELSAPARGAAYAAIGIAATGFAIERVRHKRHHVSDVVVGGLIGTATSLAIYRYQQGRFEDAAGRASPRRSASLRGPADPDLSTPTTLSITLAW